MLSYMARYVKNALIESPSRGGTVPPTAPKLGAKGENVFAKPCWLSEKKIGLQRPLSLYCKRTFLEKILVFLFGYLKCFLKWG